MNTADRAETLARQGRIADAFDLLTGAVAAGDSLAALTLADWRMAGGLIRRDMREARRLYGVAADLGNAEASPYYAALLANGAGGIERHWADAVARQKGRAAELLGAMAIDAEGDPLTPAVRELLSVSPRIERLPGFLTPGECRYLGGLATPRLAPAVVVNPATGQQHRDPVRTGESTGFPFIVEEPVLHAINRRIAHATATTYDQGEPLQVLSYMAGQEYKLHSDALPPGDNQRIATFLVRLNDGFTGGATSFPRLGLEWTGKPGDALFFVNTDSAGQPDAAMWHAGLPVTQGRKLLLSKWIRERPLDLAGPPGRPF